MPTPPRRQGGFTFLWLLFLVAGLGVAMAAVGTLWHTAAQREKEKQLLFVGDEYRRAIESFQKIPLPAGQQARLPKTFDELLLDPRFQHTVRHLRRLYPDPMANEAEWGLVRDAQGGISGVFSNSLDKPLKQENFPEPYQRFAQTTGFREWVFTPEAAVPAGPQGVQVERPATEERKQNSQQNNTLDSGDQSNSEHYKRLGRCTEKRNLLLTTECIPLQKDYPTQFHACYARAEADYQACLHD